MAHMNTREYARLLREWVTGIGLQPEEAGTHSLRRTKYRQPKKRRATCVPFTSCWACQNREHGSVPWRRCCGCPGVVRTYRTLSRAYSTHSRSFPPPMPASKTGRSFMRRSMAHSGRLLNGRFDRSQLENRNELVLQQLLEVLGGIACAAFSAGWINPAKQLLARATRRCNSDRITAGRIGEPQTLPGMTRRITQCS